MSAYYNEIDPDKTEWLREVIKAGIAAPGDVDERSISDVRPGDLRGYTQCHFFAGIGVWSYALRLAGWPDDREVWTGSCPCQPFSAAGKQERFNDERHLWPEFFRLIRGCRPSVIFGEQVSSSIRGTNLADTDLPTLQGKEILLRLLRQLKGATPRNLYRVREGAGEDSQAVGAGRSFSPVSGMAGQEARARSGECGEVPSETERPSLHVGPDGDSGTHRPWVLRSYGDTVRSYQASLLECALTGSDQPEAGVYARKYTGDSLFLECDGERLGHPEGSRDGECDPRSAFQAKRRLDRIFEHSFEGEIGESWLDLISDDLEAEGYTLGPAVLGAHSAGSPNIRQRLYFCADSDGDSAGEGRLQHLWEQRLHPKDGRCDGDSRQSEFSAAPIDTLEPRSSDHSLGTRLEGLLGDVREWRGPGWLDPLQARSASEAGATRGFWADCDWWYGRDGKYRPIGPGLFPLAHGAAARVLRLRGYGDAINPWVAKAFIEAFCEATR